MLIGSARVSTADGSQSLARPLPAGRGHPGPVISFGVPASPPIPLDMEGDTMRSICVPFHIEGRRSLDDVLVLARPPQGGQELCADRDGHSGP